MPPERNTELGGKLINMLLVGGISQVQKRSIKLKKNENA